MCINSRCLYEVHLFIVYCGAKTCWAVKDAVSCPTQEDDTLPLREKEFINNNPGNHIARCTVGASILALCPLDTDLRSQMLFLESARAALPVCV